MDIVILLLALLTFMAALVQTSYANKSLKAAQDSLEIYKVSRQLEQLPKMEYIITVNIRLAEWKKELEELIGYIECNNLDKIIEFSKKSIKRQSLIDKWDYENMPKWLSIIYLSGAQYYYNSSCLYEYLEKSNETKTGLINLLDRFKESVCCLGILLGYIQGEVPKVFLECPASLSARDFMK